jgi:hypothetical protein
MDSSMRTIPEMMMSLVFILINDVSIRLGGRCPLERRYKPKRRKRGSFFFLSVEEQITAEKTHQNLQYGQKPDEFHEQMEPHCF